MVRLKVAPAAISNIAVPYFNSTMVRLKEQLPIMYYIIVHNFNSTMVRLKVFIIFAPALGTC